MRSVLPRSTARLGGAALALLAACGASDFPTPTSAAATTSLRTATTLVRPVTEPEQLLGRAVERAADGTWKISAEREPGCQVALHRTATATRERSRNRVHSLAAVEADYLRLLELGGASASVSDVEIDVQQTEVLTGQLSGPCGTTVITTVYVGRGSQSLFGQQRREVHLGAGIARAGLRGSYGDESERVDGIAWDTPLGYAFEVGRGQSTDALRISTDLPSLLHEGEPLRFSVRTSRPAYVLVISRDSEGREALLWPTNEEPYPRCDGERPLQFPSPVETEAGYTVRVTLPPDTTAPVRESIVVHGFSERGDYETVHPHANGDGPEFLAALPRHMESIPRARRATYIVGVTLQPTDGR
jgi:hypothetical protein